MTMQFGKKFDRNSAVKEASTELSGLNIWGFQSGATVVRLLDDLEDWTEYWEHYDPTHKKYFPCTGDRSSCNGCVTGLNSSHKWLANAFVVSADTGSTGYVNLYKFPKSIITKVMRHADKRGTLLSNEYEIFKSGTGKDTEYDLERGAEGDFDFDKYLPQAVSHEDALMAAYEEYMAAFTNVSTPTEAPAERTRAPREPVAAAPAPAHLRAAVTDPPSEPQAPVAVAEVVEAGEEILDEDEILAMEFAELVELAKRAGLDVPESFVDAEETARWLIDTIGTD